MIKRICFLFLILGCKANAQKRVVIDSITNLDLKRIFPTFVKDSIPEYYYRIQYGSQKLNLEAHNAFDFLKNASLTDTLKVIEDLLNFKGDKHLCAVPITACSINPSNHYDNRRTKFCTIEIEALFIIHQILAVKPIQYLPYPVLISTRRKTNLTSEQMVDRAYKAHHKWFKKVKKRGLWNVSKPFQGSNIEWYR